MTDLSRNGAYRLAVSSLAIGSKPITIQRRKPADACATPACDERALNRTVILPNGTRCDNDIHATEGDCCATAREAFSSAESFCVKLKYSFGGGIMLLSLKQCITRNSVREYARTQDELHCESNSRHARETSNDILAQVPITERGISLLESNVSASLSGGPYPFGISSTDEKWTPEAICGDDDLACFVGSLQYSLHSVPARRKICHERDHTDAVSILCDGWASAQVAMPDGRRQILSIILPGDILSVALLVDSSPHCVVEAITDVRYRAYKRNDFKRALVNNPDMIDKLLKVSVKRMLRGDQLIIDLGRRTAAERIARLILGLMERLMRSGLIQGPTMEFPLRQHHIADATGLTPPHVSNVLMELRQRKLIELAGRTLTITDLPALRRLALSR